MQRKVSSAASTLLIPSSIITATFRQSLAESSLGMSARWGAPPAAIKKIRILNDEKKFGQWRAGNPLPAEKLEAAADNLAFRIRAYLGASGAGFLTFYNAMLESIAQAADNALINPAAIETFCRESASIETRSMTVGELRKALGNTPDVETQTAGLNHRKRCKVTVEVYRVIPDDAVGREFAQNGGELPHTNTLTKNIEYIHLWRVALPDGRRLNWRIRRFSVTVAHAKDV